VGDWMQNKIFLEKLQQQYSYSEKLMHALEKIFPILVSYYGKEHQEMIERALYHTRIVECNSYQTIALVLKDLLPSFTFSFDPSVGGVYVSYPSIAYSSVVSSYIISNVSRLIVLSHTYNLDAISGLSILTEQLCRLIRSFPFEYRLAGNELLQKSGICCSKYLLEQKNDQVVSVLVSKDHCGFEEGCVSYDTERIVSLLVKDTYHHFSAEFEKKIAFVFYDYLRFEKILLASLFSPDFTVFFEQYHSGSFSKLSSMIDQAWSLEKEGLQMNVSKDEKMEINQKLLVLSDRIVQNISFYLETQKKRNASKNLVS